MVHVLNFSKYFDVYSLTTKASSLSEIFHLNYRRRAFLRPRGGLVLTRPHYRRCFPPSRPNPKRRLVRALVVGSTTIGEHDLRPRAPPLQVHGEAGGGEGGVVSFWFLLGQARPRVLLSFCFCT